MSARTPGLDWYLTTAIGPNGIVVQNDPNASIGGYVSITKVDTSVIFNNLWDTVTQSESTTGALHYRVAVLANYTGSAFPASKLWMPSQVPAGSAWSMALDAMGVQPAANVGYVSTLLANESTGAGLTFSAPQTQALGIDVPALPDQHVIGVHLQRNVPPNTPEVVTDGCTIDVVVL